MFTEIAKVQQRRYCIQNSQQRRCGVQFLDYIFVPNKMLIYSNVHVYCKKYDSEKLQIV